MSSSGGPLLILLEAVSTFLATFSYKETEPVTQRAAPESTGVQILAVSLLYA